MWPVYQLRSSPRSIDEREQALDTFAAQLNTSPLTSMSFASQPLAGTWTPKVAYSNCTSPINVTVLRLWKDKDEDIMKAQIFWSPPVSKEPMPKDSNSDCASFTKTVTKDDGTLKVQSQAWTLN